MDTHHVAHGNQNFRLIACPHILSSEKGRIDCAVPEGATVAGHLRALGWPLEAMHARVFIDGQFIERAQWEYAVPRAGQSFVARAIPMGGENGKSALRIVAMIAIMVAAVWTGGVVGVAFGTLYGAVAGAAVSIVGTLAMNGLIPTPLPRRALSQPVLEPRRQVAA